MHFSADSWPKVQMCHRCGFGLFGNAKNLVCFHFTWSKLPKAYWTFCVHCSFNKIPSFIKIWMAHPYLLPLWKEWSQNNFERNNFRCQILCRSNLPLHQSISSQYQRSAEFFHIWHIIPTHCVTLSHCAAQYHRVPFHSEKIFVNSM